MKFCLDILLILLLAATAPAMAKTGEQPPCEPERTMQLPRPETYAGYFMAAVERESLLVLGHRVDSAIIRPVRVEYLYSLDGEPPMVQVHAILKLPMELEGFPDCRVSAVTAVMTIDGTIVEVQAHIETF